MVFPTLSRLRIFTDSQTRRLYANDASMYEELPEGVAFPKNKQEIQELVQKANRESFSLIPRSAGTSLAGQATGGGVVMDISRHMNQLLEVKPEQEFAHLQPGVIRDTLNRKAAKHNLHFGPDTATSSRCMLGGMIGNNSCGSFSIKHKTTREHVLEIEAVLSDGSTATFKPLSQKELEQKKQLNNLEGRIYRSLLKLVERNRDQILSAYPHPEIIRRNTGYALDKLCTMHPFEKTGRPLNLAELLCGSEGTLALTASAKVRLVPKDTYRILIAPHFSSINKAMEATVEAVKFDPSAAELVDDIILNATKDNLEQRKNRFFLKGEPKCILIVQFEGNQIEVILQKAQALQKKLDQKELSTTVPVIVDEDQIDRVWELRKAGLGLLMGLGSDERSPSFCEDTAVRVRDLPKYIKEFKQLLQKYETHCVFYGHASVGELHLRPILDIQTEKGIQKMKAMADEAAGLVKKYNGSLSGEHGDGRARAPYIEKVLGEEMMPLLQKVKEIWDPNYIFNPGKIIQPEPIENDLRLASSSQKNDIKTQFYWRKEGSFSEALDLCNGAGVCRKLAESGGTMCPSYMATKEEKDTTRGRANLFRQLFAGEGAEAFSSDELYNALDLCISCKGCKSECPANVDMARMKAEFTQGWHDEQGITLSERFFAHAGTFYPFASKFSKLSNRLMQSPAGKEILFQLFNIHKKRTLPGFAQQTFMEWFEGYSSWDDRVCHPMSRGTENIRRTSKPGARRRVALFIDIFTNYHEPEIGKATVKVLEKMGFEALVPDFMELGRTQLSKGFVKQAKKLANKNIAKLHAYADQNIPIVGLEPSEILTLRDEYLDLCDDELLAKAEAIAEYSFQFEEFFANEVAKRPELKKIFHADAQEVYLHGHCHSKALTGNEATLKALKMAGYQPKALQTGCCGMAGSFGYEADHYDVSMDIGNLVLFPSLKKLNENALVCAPGFSCRHQIMDGTGRKAFHLTQLLCNNIKKE